MPFEIIQKITDELNKEPHPDISAGPSETVISINRLTGAAGTWYEKIRYLLDYQEERFIRRSAIERILKRKLLFADGKNIGPTLLQELIRGGYLPNNSVPERLAAKVDMIVAKFMLLSRLAEAAGSSTSSFRRRSIGLAASEIHRFIFPSRTTDIVAEAFYQKIKNRITFVPPLPASEGDLQTYIACRRSLLKETDEELSYALWLRFVSGWQSFEREEEIKNIAVSAPLIIEKILSEIKNPVSWKLAGKLKNQGIFFLLIKEIFDKYGVEAGRIFDDPNYFSGELKHSLEEKYKEEHRRANKSGFRAVAYIFCTKILVALLLELPYDIWVLHGINYLALGVNVVFHPVLLFAITGTILKLKEDNTERIITGINAILGGNEIPAIRIRTAAGGTLFDLFLVALYCLLFIISFGIILSVLNLLNFNIASIILFLFFLTLVSYFGLRIRHNAKDWKVAVDNESTLSLLWGVFTLPVVRAGRWLSKTFSSINVFLLIMDFVIEAPFKIVLRVLDAFLSYLKDKREEVH